MRRPDPERWRIIEPILDQALELPPVERSAFLARACGDDEGLRDEVAYWLDAAEAVEERNVLPSPDDVDALLQQALQGARPAPDASDDEPPLQALPEGTRLADRYDLEKVLGHGGFGITYLAHDVRLQTRVAVKEFFPLFSGRGGRVVRRPEQHTVVASGTRAVALFEYGLKQFLEEARMLARFDDPHLVRVKDHFEANGTAYMVMEYCEGEPLGQYLAGRGGRLAEQEAVHIVLSVLAGLRVVHGHHILHRDVKPSNIMRAKTGEVVLLDFGAARLAMSEQTQRLTQIGSPGYAPWEQVAGARQGPWTDLYACGALLYRLVTGETPQRDGQDRITLPSEIVASISPALSTALTKALQADPKHRFQTVDAFEKALRRVLAERTRKKAPLQRAALAGVAGLLVLLVLYALWPPSPGGNPLVHAYLASLTGLPANDADALAVDTAGTLWIGTPGRGLIRYDGRVWTTYTPDNSSLPGYAVRSLALDPQGVLWVGTSAGLARRDGDDFTVFADSLFSAGVLALATGANRELWIGTDAGTLALLDGATGKVVHARPVEKWSRLPDPNDAVALSLAAAAQRDAVWVGTPGGLDLYSNLDVLGMGLAPVRSPGIAADLILPAGGVRSLAVDALSRLWVGTSAGLVRLIEGQPDAYTIADGLPANQVNTLALDPSGTLWAGTSEGLARRADTTFTTYPRGPLRGDVRSLTFDARGLPWVGTRHNGLAHFDGNDWRYYFGPPSGVKHIGFDRRGRVWIGTEEQGLAHFDGAAWTTYSRQNGLPDDHVTSLALDPQGNLWVGTLAGLAHFDGAAWTTYSRQNGLPDDYVTSLALDPRGNLWVGTLAGLAHFDGAAWTVYSQQNTDLPDHRILSLTLDHGGTPWAGTWSGLVHFDGAAWTVYSQQNADLPSLDIRSLAFDLHGHLWVGTTAGLARFDGAAWTVYSQQNADLPDTFVQALAVDPYGDLWIGTLGRLAILQDTTFVRYP